MTNSRPSVMLGALLVVISLLPTLAWAGSVEYLSNQSADYIRTFSRNAAIDGADIVSYNPAGTAFMKENLYLAISNQTLLGEYAIEYDGQRYPAEVMVPVLPSIHAVVKLSSFALFGAVTVPSGGGALEYKDGLPYLMPMVTFVKDPDGPAPKDGYFAGSSVTYGLTLGGSYNLWNLISFSAALRVNYSDKGYAGHATYGTVKAELETQKTALGVTPILGVAVRPGLGLTIAARYELVTPMEYTATTTTKNMKPAAEFAGTALESFVDGAKEQRDMPAVLGLGISWTGFGLTLSSSAHLYLTKGADSLADYQGIKGTDGLGAYAKGWHDAYEDGWDLAFAVEYQWTDKLLISGGFVHADVGGNKKTLTDFEQALDSNSFGAGARYELLDSFRVTLAVSRTFYEEGQNEALVPIVYAKPETFTKEVMDIALGLQFVF